MVNYKKLIKIILLISISVFGFLAGILFNSHIKVAVLCFFISIISQIVREKLQANIEGDGVHKITVGEIIPNNPQKGDWWIDTKKT